MARYCLGRPGWRDDLRHGLAMARSADPLTYAAVVAWGYFPESRTARWPPTIARCVRSRTRCGLPNDPATTWRLAFAQVALGVALVHRRTAAERDRGQTLLAEVSDVFARHAHNLGDLPLVDVYVAREKARRGDRDDAIPLMRAAVDHLFREGQLLAWGIPATGVLVDTLLDRGAASDVAEAEAAIERLADAPADDDIAIREIWLLRLRALLARARGDETAYRGYRDRYRDRASALGFEGHMTWAEAMP